MSRTKVASVGGAAPSLADTNPGADVGLADLLYFAISSCAEGKLLPGATGSSVFSKAMTASRHSNQTITVGTVHYMAPEIGQGRYDRSIDIYALGCMLYEMLTGQTPFLGGSTGEILMKHLTQEPKLDS
ncbi:MAG TPA: protein kinase, partial [Candidatus Paceibacterota bacterium]|nr:protein kinase [Candidatus Paceibacterota bacterium]